MAFRQVIPSNSVARYPNTNAFQHQHALATGRTWHEKNTAVYFYGMKRRAEAEKAAENLPDGTCGRQHAKAQVEILSTCSCLFPLQLREAARACYVWAFLALALVLVLVPERRKLAISSLATAREQSPIARWPK